ncbi:MAG: hypothetical protein ACOYJC_09015 [Christensenellales bacterium]|jgi:hypothetical protein
MGGPLQGVQSANPARPGKQDTAVLLGSLQATGVSGGKTGIGALCAALNRLLGSYSLMGIFPEQGQRVRPMGKTIHMLTRNRAKADACGSIVSPAYLV